MLKYIRLGYFTVALLGVFGFVATAQAATVGIVALGASNTTGKGVSSSEAWPAQLEGMLKAKGYDVSMTVNGLNGDTSAGIASRVGSIPAGTQIVLYDTGADNDRKAGVAGAERQAHIAQIASGIRARGAVAIEVNYSGFTGSLRQADGVHLTAEGHRRLAGQLLPRVVAAIGKRH